MFNGHLNGFNESDQHWFLKYGKVKSISANEVVISEGKPLNEIFFIISGLFAIKSAEGNQYMLVGDGEMLGGTTFASQGQVAAATISAVDQTNTVLVIPVPSLKEHIAADHEFASRFYQFAAKILSERMKRLLSSFVTPLKDHLKKPVLTGPVNVLENDVPNFKLLNDIYKQLTPLSAIFKSLKQGQNVDALLSAREKALSVATLSADAIKIIFTICNDLGLQDLDEKVITHQASLTAYEKQMLLPEYEIQKTLTVMLENKFIIYSTMGDTQVSHDILKLIAHMIDLPLSHINSYINPAIFVPEIEIGLLRGMVSTFFPPQRLTKISQVILNTSSQKTKEMIAVSLSPFESLLLPSNQFSHIAENYAKIAYPYIPFAKLNI